MSLLRPRPNRRLDRCESSLPSPFSASLFLSLSPFSRPSLALSSLPPPLSIYLPLSLYLFAISLCASPRRVLTANNAPRDALENIHFSCRGDEKEKEGKRGREDRTAIHAGSKIYFRDQKLSAHRFGNEHRRSQIFRMPSEIPRSYARFDLSARHTELVE